MKISGSILALAALAGGATTAQAAVTYDVQNDKLVAIRGIGGSINNADDPGVSSTFKSGGTTYAFYTDIEFFDGPCSTGFNYCDTATNYVGVARRIPLYLQPYLVDNVTVGGKTYNFESATDSIFGCTDTTSCRIFAGVDRTGISTILPMTTLSNTGSGYSSVGLQDDVTTLDTSKLANATYARLRSYSVAVSTAGAVPEPATWAMMLFGFGGLGYTMRRRPRAATRIRFA